MFKVRYLFKGEPRQAIIFGRETIDVFVKNIGAVFITILSVEEM
jgi:hypothetical protein